MRSPLLLVVSLLLVSVSVFAQEPAATEPFPNVVPLASQDKASDTNIFYLIELVEFRLSGSRSPTLTAEEILDRLNQPAEDDEVGVIQTFHLSAVARQESTAKAGRMAAIMVGVQSAPGRLGLTAAFTILMTRKQR